MSAVAFGEMWLLCVAARQPAGVQAAEAQALYQTANPAAEAFSSATEAQHSAPFSKTSTWTGLVDLDNAGVHSIAGINNSSEISEEHVVIHLRPEEGLDEKRDGPRTSQPSREEESDAQESSNTLGHSDLGSLESHGGSAHEEEDGGYFGSSDTPTLSSLVSSTPQSQTSNSVLAEFVNTLMRPFRYWTGGKEVQETEKGISVLEEKAGENQTQGEATSRNLSIPKPSGNKGSMDNAIMEHRSGSFSFRPPKSEIQSPEEGLSEQEREVMPLIRLVPAVQSTGQSDTTTQPGERASSTSAANPPSAVDDGMSSTLILFASLLCVFRVHL